MTEAQYLFPLIAGTVFFVLALFAAWLSNRHEDREDKRRKHQKIGRK